MPEETLEKLHEALMLWLEDNTDWWDPNGNANRGVKKLLKEFFENV